MHGATVDPEATIGGRITPTVGIWDGILNLTQRNRVQKWEVGTTPSALLCQDVILSTKKSKATSYLCIPLHVE